MINNMALNITKTNTRAWWSQKNVSNSQIPTNQFAIVSVRENEPSIGHEDSVMRNSEWMRKTRNGSVIVANSLLVLCIYTFFWLWSTHVLDDLGERFSTSKLNAFFFFLYIRRSFVRSFIHLFRFVCCFPSISFN